MSLSPPGLNTFTLLKVLILIRGIYVSQTRKHTILTFVSVPVPSAGDTSQCRWI